MSSEFENQLQRQPLRQIPPHWRARILAAAQTQPARSRWLEWLAPAPQAWAVLGAAWVVIFALHLTTPDDPRPAHAFSVTPESLAALQEKQLMLMKLLSASEDAEPPARQKPRGNLEWRQHAG
jgi:hypothetical protein